MSFITKMTLIGFFITVFTGVIFLMPDAQELPEAIANSITIIVNYLYAFDFILPVDALITTFGVAITFEFVLWGWRIARYIIKLGSSVLGGGNGA